MIRVCYFASLREQLGLAEEPLELPAGVADVADLRTADAQRVDLGGWIDGLGLDADGAHGGHVSRR